jgi:uncharacterized protein (TIGR03067 family)
VSDGTVIRITGNRITFREHDTDKEWTLCVDSQKSPKQVTITVPGKDQIRLGIYHASENTLTICYGEPGGPRPEEFGNLEQWRLVLKRPGSTPK